MFNRRDAMMPRHVQLEIDQSYVPVVCKLMDGHSGAAIALIDLLRHGRKIGVPVSDDAAWCLMMLDAFDIHGVSLYVFWNDVCEHSAEQMFKLLKACDEGCHGISQDSIMQAIAYCNRDTPLKKLQLVS